MTTNQLEPPLPTCFAPRRYPDEPLLGELVSRGWREDLDAVDVVILGCPDQQGLLLNHGREGAAEGPDAIRRALYALSPGCETSLEELHIVDAGNLRTGARQPELHATLQAVVERLAAAAGAVVLLGGSHDLSFPAIRGLARARAGHDDGPGVVLVDAHLDVRGTEAGVTNGSPFYCLMEQGVLRGDRFVVLGAQEAVTAKRHQRRVISRGGRIVWRGGVGSAVKALVCESLTAVARQGLAVVSVDIDAAAQAAAPGTGAPSPDGLSPRQMVDIGRAAGEHPAVAYLDVMEVSPPLDRDGQTAALAAAVVDAFLRGLVARRRAQKST